MRVLAGVALALATTACALRPSVIGTRAPRRPHVLKRTRLSSLSASDGLSKAEVDAYIASVKSATDAIASKRGGGVGPVGAGIQGGAAGVDIGSIVKVSGGEGPRMGPGKTTPPPQRSHTHTCGLAPPAQAPTHAHTNPTPHTHHTLTSTPPHQYPVCTALQIGVIAGLFKGIDSIGALPAPLVWPLFAFLSLRSRFFSALPASRPPRGGFEDGGKKVATPAETKRPSWTPPGFMVR